MYKLWAGMLAVYMFKLHDNKVMLSSIDLFLTHLRINFVMLYINNWFIRALKNCISLVYLLDFKFKEVQKL